MELDIVLKLMKVVEVVLLSVPPTTALVTEWMQKIESRKTGRMPGPWWRDDGDWIFALPILLD